MGPIGSEYSSKEAPALEKNVTGFQPLTRASTFVKNYMDEPFDGGFHIESVKTTNGKPLSYVINQTMMRVDLPSPIPPGGQYSFPLSGGIKSIITSPIEPVRATSIFPKTE